MARSGYHRSQKSRGLGIEQPSQAITASWRLAADRERVGEATEENESERDRQTQRHHRGSPEPPRRDVLGNRRRRHPRQGTSERRSTSSGTSQKASPSSEGERPGVAPGRIQTTVVEPDSAVAGESKPPAVVESNPLPRRRTSETGQARRPGHAPAKWLGHSTDLRADWTVEPVQ